MQECVKKRFRVILLTTEDDVKKAKLTSILEDKRIEIVFVRKGKKLFNKVFLPICENEHVVMLTCEPVEYVAAELYRRTCNNKSFVHYLVLPHFTGNAYYPERYFKVDTIRNYIWNYWKKLISQIDDNNTLVAFSMKHLEYYEKNYNIHIINKEKKLIPLGNVNSDIDQNILRYRVGNRAERFEIVTCTRFDFPHKGYVVGLIKSVAKLMSKYLQIYLTIVGDGDDRNILEKEISSYPTSIKNRIVLVGFLTPEKVREVFAKASLNIGVAGALIDGAAEGVISIPVRHYSYECEGYGYFEDVPDMFLSEEKGDSIEKYIEEVIQMDDDCYLQHCISAKNTAITIRNRNRMRLIDLMENTDVGIGLSLTATDILIARVINYYSIFAKKILNISPYKGD